MRELTSTLGIKKNQTPLRAIVEIVDHEFQIYAIADSDTDERRILDALQILKPRT